MLGPTPSAIGGIVMVGLYNICPIQNIAAYIEVVFTDGMFITLSGVVVIVFIFEVPESDHGAQIIGRVVDMVLPSVVLPVGDGGQVRELKVALTCIHCGNIGQLIAPDLHVKN